MDDKVSSLLAGPVVAINVGVQGFGAALEEQGVTVIFVK